MYFLKPYDIHSKTNPLDIGSALTCSHKHPSATRLNSAGIILHRPGESRSSMSNSANRTQNLARTRAPRHAAAQMPHAAVPPAFGLTD